MRTFRDAGRDLPRGRVASLSACFVSGLLIAIGASTALAGDIEVQIAAAGRLGSARNEVRLDELRKLVTHGPVDGQASFEVELVGIGHVGSASHDLDVVCGEDQRLDP